jgi:hypothetical protein
VDISGSDAAGHVATDESPYSGALTCIDLVYRIQVIIFPVADIPSKCNK